MYKENSLFGKLMGFLNMAGTMILANLLFLAGCIPIVTAGASLSGLYSALRFRIRGDGWFQGYKEGFRRHFLRNTVAWTAGAGIGYLALNQVYNLALGLSSGALIPDSQTVALLVGSSLFLLADAVFLTIMIPVGLYIDGDVNQWIGDTWHLVFHAPLQTVASVAVIWLPVILFLVIPELFFDLLIAVVAVYFVLGSVVVTILLKKPLISILNQYKNNKPESERSNEQ